MKIQIQEWCRQAYDKALKLGNYGTKNKYQDVPKEARVLNPLSSRAAFSSCVMRRKGYIIHVNAIDLSRLDDHFTLSETRRALLEDAWLRGVIWKPPLIRAELTDNGWFIRSIEDRDVVAFLGLKGGLLTAQVIEPKDVPATKEKLCMLKAGLFDKHSWRCPILFARITY